MTKKLKNLSERNAIEDYSRAVWTITNTSVMTKTNTIEIERNAKEDLGRAVWTKHKYKYDGKDKYN